MPIVDNFKDKILDSRAFVQKHQRFIPVFSFFAGFTWDSVTITRIDEVSDNLIIGLYLLLLGFLIILTLNSENNRLKKPLLIKYSQWYPTGIQFFLGGLFSAYVVFYFKSFIHQNCHFSGTFNISPGRKRIFEKQGDQYLSDNQSLLSCSLFVFYFLHSRDYRSYEYAYLYRGQPRRIDATIFYPFIFIPKEPDFFKETISKTFGTDWGNFYHHDFFPSVESDPAGSFSHEIRRHLSSCQQKQCRKHLFTPT